MRPGVAYQEGQGGPLPGPQQLTKVSQGGPIAGPPESPELPAQLDQSRAPVSDPEIDRLGIDRSIDHPALAQAEADALRTALESFRLASGPCIQATRPLIGALVRVTQAYGRTVRQTLAALERIRRRVNGKRDLWPAEPIPWFRAVLTTEFEREDAERTPTAAEGPPAQPKPPAIEERAALAEMRGLVATVASRVRSL